MKRNVILIIGTLVTIMIVLFVGSGMSCESSPFEVRRTRKILDALIEEDAESIASLITIQFYQGEVYYGTNADKNELKELYIKNLNNFFETNEFDLIDIKYLTDTTDDCFSKTQAEGTVLINGSKYDVFFFFGGSNRVNPGSVQFIKSDNVIEEDKEVLERFEELFSTMYAG